MIASGVLSARLVLAYLLFAHVSVAQETKPSGPAKGGIPRDPKGVKGVSPLMEKLAPGDSAITAGNVDAALAAYSQAIKDLPESALLYARLAEAHTLKGSFQEAEASYETALRFVGDDGLVKSKILFALGLLSENQKLLAQAIERYTACEEFAKTTEKGKLFVASAGERRKRISDWVKIEADSASAKGRIARRLKEAEESVRKSSQ